MPELPLAAGLNFTEPEIWIARKYNSMSTSMVGLQAPYVAHLTRKGYSYHPPYIADGSPQVSVKVNGLTLHLRSYMRDYLLQDFQEFNSTKITREMLNSTWPSRDWPEYGFVAHVAIVAGVPYYSNTWEGLQVPPAGWFGAEKGRPDASAHALQPHLMLMVARLLHDYGPEVPDVEFFVSFWDEPRFPKSDPARRFPNFAFDSSDDFFDIPFPDFSWLGHDMNYINPPDGSYLMGWDQESDYIRSTFRKPLSERKMLVTFRGRTDWIYRDVKRREFLECEKLLKEAGVIHRPSGIFDAQNVGYFSNKHMTKAEMYESRYLAYIESEAYSYTLKDKLASGSAVVTWPLIWYEWFSRALRPDVHYLAVDKDHFCGSVYRNVVSAEAVLKERIAAEARGETFRPGDKSGPDPQEIANNAVRFIAEKVRERDAIEYTLDALKIYAAY